MDPLSSNCSSGKDDILEVVLDPSKTEAALEWKAEVDFRIPLESARMV